MNLLVESRLEALKKLDAIQYLAAGARGLEKESLRVAESGGIAMTPHPAGLGAALTHPWITTDYSEALAEFITPPLHCSQDVLCFLQDVQTFVYRKLPHEKLWATSMPCILNGGANIPIADYGHSNAGMMKTVYRRGLGFRYGRVMQVISGVHFNYSLTPEFWGFYRQAEGSHLELRQFRDVNYMAMIRNLQRFGWLIPYLMGASPAVCKSFFGDKQTDLDVFDDSTYYEPYATSLRMGDMGYQNSKEEGLGVKANYNSLDAYVESLRKAITTPAAVWQKIGVVVDGYWRQLNANILQIENEYYSTVRPKPILKGLDKPVNALRDKGIEYIELRSLDVNAYHPLGIDEAQLDFLEVFVLYCLLNDSPEIHAPERAEIDQNILTVAHRGRTPLLKLRRQGGFVALKEWAGQLFAGMQPIAELLDAVQGGGCFQDSLQTHLRMIEKPELTPSARMLDEMRQNGESFYGFANRMSQTHRRHFALCQISSERLTFFEESVRESHRKQKQIEEFDNISFTDFIKQYEQM